MESEAAIKTRDLEQFDNASSDNGVKFSDKPFAYYAQVEPLFNLFEDVSNNLCDIVGFAGASSSIHSCDH